MNDQGDVQPGPACAKDIAPASGSGTRSRGQRFAVCCLLLLAVGLVFGQTTGFQFVNFDDGSYVYDNPQISDGLTARGVAWVFTHAHGANWHPLTGLSHLADCQLFGLNAGAHHLTNVLLHAATAVLLFLILWRMTGGFWPCAMVAALFAVHPLRVESVAWISERKDVLSGFCFVLTLAAYVRYVRNPFSLDRYLLLAVVFALGLMAKPMLVTLPFVLLLLDYWPLGRFAGSACFNLSLPRTLPHGNGGGFAGDAKSLQTFFGRFSLRWQLVLEKLPLLLLAALSCLVTLGVQGNAAAINLCIPLTARIANASVAYVAYLVDLFFPVGLAAFYPHAESNLPLWKVFASTAVLVGISVGALTQWRRRPYLLVGWLWYVGMLVPVIGIVQVGTQAMADRYTYLPQIGLYLALTWAALDLCRSWPHRRWLWGVTSALVLAVLMGCAWRQTSFWYDSETLWPHALACTASNCVAHNDWGNALISRGQVQEAIAHYQEALAVDPAYSEAHNNLANALAKQGRLDEALAHYRRSLEIQPNYAEAYYNLGNLLARRGQCDAAIVQFQRALAITDYAEAHNNLGNALSRWAGSTRRWPIIKGPCRSSPSWPTPIATWATPCRAEDKRTKRWPIIGGPWNSSRTLPGAYCALGSALARGGRLKEALPRFRKALELKPDLVDAYDQLGLALSGLGRYEEALSQYRKALQVNPDDATAHRHLAWLLATCPKASLRNGAEAIEHAQQANQLCGGKRPDVLDALAAGYAEAGWFPEALAAARKGLQLATQQDQPAWAEGLQRESRSTKTEGPIGSRGRESLRKKRLPIAARRSRTPSLRSSGSLPPGAALGP